MIGTFKTARDASKAMQDLERLMDIAADSIDFDRFDENPMIWYTDPTVRAILEELHLHYFSSEDIRQLVGDHQVKPSVRSDHELVLWTDENDLGAFLKYLIDRAARVEVFSAHDYPESAAGLT